MRVKTNSIINLLIALSILSSLAAPFIEILNFYDEFVTIVTLLVLIYVLLFKGVQEKFPKYLLIILLCLSFISIVSTIYSPFKNVLSASFFDYFMSLKPIIVLLGFYTFSNDKSVNYIGKKLRFLALFLIAVLLPVAIYSNLYVNSWVFGQSRYGIYPFQFIFGFAADFGFFIIALMMLLFFSDFNMNKLSTWLGFIAGTILILMTTKIQVITFIICFWILLVFFKHKIRLNIFTLSLLGSVLVSVGSLQLNHYFLDINRYSPRKILLTDSMNIANSLFPLGSGLGTFGSEMASRFYSPIYTQLGYYNLYGLNGDNSALNDSFTAMLIAQFGWIGTIIFYFFLILVTIKVTKLKNYKAKALSFSLILTVVIASIGSGSIKSNTGIMIFSLLGILLKSFGDHYNYKT